MASFTDAISQFNPYVAQLPVEAMAKVGMQKQAQYEQGVQKIQAYIDNVAGMDVAHDADKAYLQSKMNQLGNNLKVVAGGDFSNQQLVNSVGGMATQIVKDPKIQNAVASTAWYKKQKEQLDKAYQEGKSSIANVTDFNTQAAAWLSKNEVGQVFRGRYSPYIDQQKKWQEIIKAINPSASSEDYAYTQFIDKDGSIKTGDLAAAMTRVTKEGVSRETIENAIRASLTPDDVNQMRIDANYRFRDITDSDQFKAALTSGYNNQVKQLDYQRAALEGIVNSTGNDSDKLKASTAIASIDAAKLKLKNGLEERINLANQNLEAAKLDYYKDESIFQTANAFSWEKKATQLLDNPALKARFEQQRINISQATLAETIRNNNWGMQQDVIKNEQWVKDHELAVKKLYGVGSGFTTYLGLATRNLALPTTDMTNKIDILKSAERSSINALAASMKIKPEEVEMKLADFRTNPSAINPRFQGLANDILNNRIEQKTIENQRKTAEETVLSLNPSLKKQQSEIDKLIANGKTLTITHTDGKKYTYSKKELFEYAAKQFTTDQGFGGFATYRPDALDEAAKKNYTPKEYLLFSYSFKRDLGNKASKDIINSALRVYNTAGKRYAEFAKELNTKLNNHLSTTNGEYVPAASLIVTPSDDSKAFYAGVADLAASKYAMPGLGIRGGSAIMSYEDATKVKQWVSSPDKNNLTYKKLNYAGETHLVVNNKGEEIIIPLSKEEAGSMPVLEGESNKFNESIYRMQRGNGASLSTNPTGKVEDSFYQRWKMPNVKRSVVFGDLNADQSNPNFQYIDLNLKGKDGRMYPMTIDTPMNASDADMWIRSLTDNKLLQLYMTSPSWKNQINNIF